VVDPEVLEGLEKGGERHEDDDGGSN
jgi:hypothetical protein